MAKGSRRKCESYFLPKTPRPITYARISGISEIKVTKNNSAAVVCTLLRQITETHFGDYVTSYRSGKITDYGSPLAVVRITFYYRSQRTGPTSREIILSVKTEGDKRAQRQTRDMRGNEQHR